jgi:hypothetical protein
MICPMAGDGRVPSLAPAAMAAGLAVTAVLLRWRGSDLPAHFFRVGLVERDGFKVWNNFWFGGHHTLGYGVLFPVLGAAVGIWTVAVASAAASAYLADRLLLATTGRRQWWASWLFAAGTVTNVAIGRLPFALGMTIGLAALLAAVHGHLIVAGGLAAATSAASPVVSVFLAIIFAGWSLAGSGRDRRAGATLAGCAVVPVLVVAALYPQGGTFPFRWSALAWVLAVCAAVAAVVPAEHRIVRATVGIYAATSMVAFLVPTPLGANVTRLGMYAAAPVVLAVGAVGPLRLVLLPLLLWWQWSPALDAIVRAGRDPSTETAYYQPLVDHLEAAGGGLDRVEIVPTRRHWEAAFVALEVPVARGWERQLDMRFHPQFYDPGLTAEELHAFLFNSGVRYVALADAPLDTSGLEEAALLEAGLPFLRERWHDEHWRVWEVLDATGLVQGPAEVLSIGSDRWALRITAPGDVLVRARADARWAADPPACIEPTADGWITLRAVAPGDLLLFVDEPGADPAGNTCPRP